MEGISITIEKEQLEWLEDQVRNEKFGSLSHGIRYALKELMNRDYLKRKNLFEEMKRRAENHGSKREN